MITLQPKKDQNKHTITMNRSEYAIGHRRHLSGVGAHRNRLEKRTGRRVLTERAIRYSES